MYHDKTSLCVFNAKQKTIVKLSDLISYSPSETVKDFFVIAQMVFFTITIRIKSAWYGSCKIDPSGDAYNFNRGSDTGSQC